MRASWIAACVLAAGAASAQKRAGLPRVLLLGDSIYGQPARAAQKMLKGRVELVVPKTRPGDSATALRTLDRLLGDGKWDLIHFNWGLHDLKYIDGKHQVPIDEYEKNLKKLVARMKQTGAKLIWCSTTPVPEGCSPPRKNEDVLKFNAVAQTIMQANNIPTDDLYTFANERLEKIQRPANVHFSPEGSKVLAGQVAKTILEALQK